MDADRISQLVRARIPELSDEDLAEIEAALHGAEGPIMLDRDVAEKIADALDAMEARLAALQEQAA